MNERMKVERMELRSASQSLLYLLLQLASMPTRDHIEYIYCTLVDDTRAYLPLPPPCGTEAAAQYVHYLNGRRGQHCCRESRRRWLETVRAHSLFKPGEENIVFRLYCCKISEAYFTVWNFPGDRTVFKPNG